MANKLSNAKKILIKKIQGNYEQQIQNARESIIDQEERRIAVVYLVDKREEKLARIKKTSKTLVAKYLGKIAKRDLLAYYQDVISNSEVFIKYNTRQLDDRFITSCY